MSRVSSIPVSWRVVQRRRDDIFYRKKLRRRICALAQSQSGFLELCQNLEGAFPSDIYNALADAYDSIPPRTLHRLLGSSRNTVGAEPAFLSQLENLILDFDWRFTTASSRKIYDLVKGLSSVLFIGTPSVYALFANTRRQCLLIDRNPYYQDHLPQHAASQIISKNIEQLRKIPSMKFTGAVIDPPWYIEDYLTWIERTVEFLEQNSIIYFPLMPRLCRPGAAVERTTLFDALRRYGQLSDCGISVAYETPSFEAAVLESFGLPALHSWRTANLFSLMPNKTQRGGSRCRSDIQVERWRRYRSGSQVAAFLESEHRPLARKQMVADRSFFLDSVSMRDERRDKINFINSRNTACYSTKAPTPHRCFERMNMMVENRSRGAAIDQDGSLEEAAHARFDRSTLS